MAYPNRTHALSEGKNTTMHIQELMTRFLLDHLPPN
jgi:dipeptidyl-peptidase-4